MNATAEQKKELRPNEGLTGLVRFCYVNLDEPVAYEDDPQKYRVTILINKKDTATLDAFKKAYEYALQTGIEKAWGGKKPTTRDFKNPLHDGDEEKPDQEEFRNCYYIYLKADPDKRPFIIDRFGNNIVDIKNEIYSGCFGRAYYSLYPFNHPKGGKGIGIGMNGIIKLRDGVKLSGALSAAEAFSGGFDYDDADDIWGDEIVENGDASNVVDYAEGVSKADGEDLSYDLDDDIADII